MSDAINPDHYKGSNGMQVIEVIQYLPFSVGNAIKYCYRNQQKGMPVQDLQKAEWYVNNFQRFPVTTSMDAVAKARGNAQLLFAPKDNPLAEQVAKVMIDAVENANNPDVVAACAAKAKAAIHAALINLQEM